MAVALIQFTQGLNTDVAGKAVLGVFEDFSAVTVTNDDNTGVVSWKIYLLDAPPDSTTFPPASQPQILAQAVDNTPTVGFTPDVAGTYRVMLEVTDALSNTDRDIRCFGIPDARGFVRPPYQESPQPLPIELPLIITEDPRPVKPDEQNYATNVRGWAGNGNVGQLDAFFRQYADLPFNLVGATPFTATETDAPLHLIDLPTIGGPATFNLPLSPREGFVARIGALATTGFPVTIQAQGGGEIGGEPTLELLVGGTTLVHQGSNEWAVLTSPGVVGAPLSNALYVDVDTTVASAAQDGSIDKPFATITAAIAAAPADGTLLVAPGDYSAETLPTISQNLTIAAIVPGAVGAAGFSSFYTGLVSVGSVTVAAAVGLFLFGVNVTGTLTLTAASTGFAIDNGLVSAIAGDGSVNAWNSTLPLPFVGNVLITNNCQIFGSPETIDLSGDTCDLAHSAFATSGATTITFTGLAGVVRVDSFTNHWIEQLVSGPGFSIVNGTRAVISALAQQAGNTLLANDTATAAIPSPFSVGTNTVVGRVAGNLVAAPLVDAQVDAAAAIALSKLAQQAGNSLVANATGSPAVPTAVAVGTNTVVGRVGANLVAAPLVNAQVDAAAAIDLSKLASQAANSVVANATGSPAVPTAVAVGTNTVVGRVGANLVASPLVNAQVDAAAAIDLSKLASQAANTLVANPTSGATTPSALAISADSFPARLAGDLSDTAFSSIDSTSIVYDGAAHEFQRAALTGHVTAPQNSNSQTIANNVLTLAMAAVISSGLGLVETLFVSQTAGGGGSPDDVTVYNADAPFSFRILKTLPYITTNVSTFTIQARTAAAGGGSPLSSEFDAGAAATENPAIVTPITATTTVSAGGSLFIRRGDSGIAFDMVFLIVKI